MTRNYLAERGDNYLAAEFVDPDKDAVQHGIKGMKWGIRRTDKQLARDTASRKAAGEEVTPTAKAAAVTASSHSGPETAQARYARLTEAAKSGGASSLSDDDLKFVNARTEALAKVNKMNQTNPGWLSTTSKKVLQNTAQKVMQEISNDVARKYITVPITGALGAAKQDESTKKPKKGDD